MLQIGMKGRLERTVTKDLSAKVWGSCGAECEFCSGCDNLGGGGIDDMYQPYIDGEKEIAEINAAYRASFVR